MGLVAAKCTQCGANIEVDASKEAGVCSHCGTAFITEKVINNYTIHNHNTVNNIIEHATISVKQDNVDDYIKRYSSFVKQGKFNAAADVVKEMDEKFPDCGVNHCCKAELHLSVKGYYAWLDYLDNGGGEPHLDSKRITKNIKHTDRKCKMFNKESAFDIDALGKVYDEFDALSDDEILSYSGDFLFVGRFGQMSNILEAEPLCYMDIDNFYPRGYDDRGYWDFSDYYGYDYEEWFDAKIFERLLGGKAVKGADDDLIEETEKLCHNFYMRAAYCAGKSIELAEDIMTDDECEKYADFLDRVKKKYEAFAAFAARREKVRERLAGIFEKLGKKMTKNARAHNRGRITKKIVKAAVIIGVIAAVALAGFLLVKKFLL